MKCLITLLICVLSFTLYSQNKMNHVHESDRLQIIKDSITITGIVKGYDYSLDGDCEVRVILDSMYVCLLNNCNFKKKEKCLVAEIICAGKSVFMECKGYVNNITVPKKGDRVVISGPYVYDRRHHWMEIHPILFLQIL